MKRVPPLITGLNLHFIDVTMPLPHLQRFVWICLDRESRHSISNHIYIWDGGHSFSEMCTTLIHVTLYV